VRAIADELDDESGESHAITARRGREIKEMAGVQHSRQGVVYLAEVAGQRDHLCQR
jgi:hypothetical protein